MLHQLLVLKSLYQPSHAIDQILHCIKKSLTFSLIYNLLNSSKSNVDYVESFINITRR